MFYSSHYFADDIFSSVPASKSSTKSTKKQKSATPSKKSATPSKQAKDEADLFEDPLSALLGS